MADDNQGLKGASQSTREEVARAGGEARKEQGADYSDLGQKGGQSTQNNDSSQSLNNNEQIETSDIEE